MYAPGTEQNFAAVVGKFHWGKPGRYLFAVGKNEEAARYSGISTRLVIAGAYVLSGLLAGVSTIFLVFYTNSVSPSAAQCSSATA